MEKAITFCLCGWNCFWLSLMPRLPVASFVIDRMSDGSIHFCGDVLTIKEHWYRKKNIWFLFKNTGESTQQLEIKYANHSYFIVSWKIKSGKQNKRQTFIDGLHWSNLFYEFLIQLCIISFNFPTKSCRNFDWIDK